VSKAQSYQIYQLTVTWSLRCPGELTRDFTLKAKDKDLTFKAKTKDNNTAFIGTKLQMS